MGWFTNWLAILMLFRPREPMRIFCWSLQGVIPSRHAQLAERIAETVENNLLTKDGTRIPYFWTGRRVKLGEQSFVVGTAIKRSEPKEPTS